MEEIRGRINESLKNITNARVLLIVEAFVNRLNK